MFDPLTETWSIVRDNPTDDRLLKGPGGLVRNNVFYVFGGALDPGITSEIKSYNPVTHEWIIEGYLPLGLERTWAILYNI